MARERFPDGAWMELRTAIGLISAGIIVIARSGLAGKLRELAALVQCFSVEWTPPDLQGSELVAALVRDFHTGVPLDRPARARITALKHDRELARRELTLAGSHAANVLRAYASPGEAEAVRRWIMWMACRVAGAGGHGWLGAGRTRADAKQQALRQLGVALGVPGMVAAPSPAELEALLGLRPR